MTRLLSLALGRLLATATLATAPVGYTLDDFDFIGAAAISQPGMVLRSEIPFQTMDDVLTAAAEGPVSYATQTTLDRLTIRALEAAGQAEAFVTLTARRCASRSAGSRARNCAASWRPSATISAPWSKPSGKRTERMPFSTYRADRVGRIEALPPVASRPGSIQPCACGSPPATSGSTTPAN